MFDRMINTFLSKTWQDILELDELKTDTDRAIMMAQYIRYELDADNTLQLIELVNQGKKLYEESVN